MDETSSANQSPPASEPPLYIREGPTRRKCPPGRPSTNEAGNEQVKYDPVLDGSPARLSNTTPRDSFTSKVPKSREEKSKSKIKVAAPSPTNPSEPSGDEQTSHAARIGQNVSYCCHCFSMQNRHAERPARRSVQPEQSDVRTNESATDNVPPNSSSNIAVKVLVVAALVLIAAVAFGSSNSSSHVPNKEPIRCNRFLRLHSKYPQLDDMLWSTLIVGVERAINENPGEPATFIFLHNSSSVGESLLLDVIDITLECFGSGSAIWRSSADFQSPEIAADYGVPLEQYRRELQSKGVLVVRNLDQVPPNAAQIFFTICDSYKPLVRKAVIFFTIDISQQPEQVVRPELSATSIAERILKDLWKRELKPNDLDPLVVQLTENVFTIA